MTLGHGVLLHARTDDDGVAAAAEPAPEPDAAFTLTKPLLTALLAGQDVDGVEYTGDAKVLTTLVSLLDDPDPDFAVVTP